MDNNLNERKRLASIRFEQLKQRFIVERQKVRERLKNEGAVLGLDGRYEEEFNRVFETFLRRNKEICEKYDLTDESE